jgi:hypothetical protein
MTKTSLNRNYNPMFLYIVSYKYLVSEFSEMGSLGIGVVLAEWVRCTHSANTTDNPRDP